MKVQILAHTPNPEELVAKSAMLCYSPVGVDEISKKLTDDKVESFVQHIIKLGHGSVLEHINFTFAIEGISRACYDDETEVMTREGWKLFKEVNNNDTIATLNSSNNQVEFHPINEKIQYQYKGDMHHYRSQNTNLMVTPNHKMFVKKYDSRAHRDFQLVASDEIGVNRVYMTKEFNYNKDGISNFITIEGFSYERRDNQGNFYTRKTKDLNFDRVDFYKLLAWYISDGSCYYCKKDNKYVISISQHKSKEKVQEIMDIFKRLGLKSCYDGSAIKSTNLTLGKFLKDLGLCNKKTIPLNLFDDFNKEYASIFINEYLKGDGCIDKNGCGKLYTTSKELSEQLYTLCYIAGYTAIVNTTKPRTHEYKGHIIKGNHVLYTISISMTGKRNHQCVIKRDKHLRSVKYDGTVYCLNVPNNILFVRRKGISMWCGNCSHQLVRHRISSHSMQSQRYVAMDSPDFITPENIQKSSNNEAYNIYSQCLNDIQVAYNKMIEMGIAKEDARYILPNATETKIVTTMNARALLNFFELRCCDRAQWEIRELANEMLDQVRKIAPNVFKTAGASCVRGFCSEGKMSCGNPQIRLK